MPECSPQDNTGEVPGCKRIFVGKNDDLRVFAQLSSGAKNGDEMRRIFSKFKVSSQLFCSAGKLARLSSCQLFRST